MDPRGRKRREENVKKIMAVYDAEPLYAERLSDYVNRKDKGLFKARAFTSRERLETFARENHVDVLLTGENIKEVSMIRSRQTIYLSEERPAERQEGQEHKIYKYQSGDDILREVMDCYGEMPEAELVFRSGGKAKRILGVYSPTGRCGKTSLALSIGQLLAREEKVLFVCLDEFTGFSRLMNERWKRDLSDLIYYYKQGRFNAARLNSIIYYMGDMAWLPPVRFPDDYNQISAEEMAGLMQQILKESDYATLILDIGNYGRQVLPLLEICHEVYMPVKEDMFSQAKQQEFDDYMAGCGRQALKERLHEVHVPPPVGRKKTELFPQELMWGDMGDFVRNVLKGQNSQWDS
jgi:hypothetical protein